MAKREKIILAIMGIVVLYGVYSIFLSSPKKAPLPETGSDLKKLGELVDTLKPNLKKRSITETDSYILARAASKWGRDPFYKEKPQTTKPGLAELLPAGIIITYSGYLKTGKKQMAIINGLEYETGEELEMGDYFVGRIYPKKVVVRNKTRDRRIIIPLEEEII